MTLPENTIPAAAPLVTLPVEKVGRGFPANELSQDFQDAFNHFNDHLFNGALPPVMIIAHRHSKAYGYFKPDTWGSESQDTVSEIAINPSFMYRPDRETLSTLVHELVHLQQHVSFTPSRNGYHNREFGDLMDAVGLTPSSTGQPGGKRTGQKVSHYIVEDGPYDVAHRALEGGGFKIRWKDIHAGGLDGPKAKKPPTRLKYTCQCDVNIWAKPGLTDVICQLCEAKFVSEDQNNGGKDD